MSAVLQSTLNLYLQARSSTQSTHTGTIATQVTPALQHQKMLFEIAGYATRGLYCKVERSVQCSPPRRPGDACHRACSCLSASRHKTRFVHQDLRACVSVFVVTLSGLFQYSCPAASIAVSLRRSMLGLRQLRGSIFRLRHSCTYPEPSAFKSESESESESESARLWTTT